MSTMRVKTKDTTTVATWLCGRGEFFDECQSNAAIRPGPTLIRIRGAYSETPGTLRRQRVSVYKHCKVTQQTPQASESRVSHNTSRGPNRRDIRAEPTKHFKSRAKLKINREVSYMR